VDLLAAEMAVERHLEGESIHAGALARGVVPKALRDELIRAGDYTPKGQRGGKTWVASSVLDAAAERVRARASRAA
jgi:hypothetical protein